MKVLFSFFILLFSISAAVYAKKDKEVDMKKFSQQLNENISENVQQNPQAYETRPVFRGPASVAPVEVAPAQEKDLDKFEELYIGHPKY